ncbi:MAG: DUF3307 domain-containing protein [Anaerolineaceae bacterium]|nr:DUF3307 domain-containing protein [Anaerolineaceae bacterium]
MNISQAFILLWIAHTLADFYLQWQKLAELKVSRQIGVLAHSFLYAGVMLASLLFAEFNPYALLLIIFSHALLDWLKYLYLHRHDPKNKEDKRKTPEQSAWLFIADQALHFVFIGLALWFWPTKGLRAWFSPVNLVSLRWLLLVLWVGKPANISFKRIFNRYGKFQIKTETVEGAGAWIGFMERLLSIIFIHLGQYSALGFTIAAKSLARFKLISDNQQFAEYYLIGTLYSILFAIFSYLLVFNVMP